MSLKIFSYIKVFCYDQVSLGKFLEFFNLSRNLNMFLNPMERRTENENSSLEKTVLVIWAQICEKNCNIVHKMS